MEPVDLDPKKLREILDQFSKELAVGFLEQRGRTLAHRQDPLEELKDVVKLLTDRERELRAAVGIAKLLLESNEQLAEQLESASGKKTRQRSQLQTLQNEVDHLKEDLNSAEEKCEQSNASLLQAEERLLAFAAENSQLKQELQLLRNIPESYRQDQQQTQAEIHRLTLHYEAQLQTLAKEKTAAVTQQQEQSTQFAQLETQHKALTAVNTRLKGELKRVKDKENRYLSDLKAARETVQTLETNLAGTKKKHSRAVSQLKKLEEEMYLLEQSTEQPQAVLAKSPDLSLMSELAELQDTFEGTSVCHLQVATADSIALPASVQTNKGDMCEEFFVLVAQCVKMNSPYKDAICSVPTSVMYQQAVAQDIPFHQWFDWIENELNAAYIRAVYRKAPAQAIVRGVKRFIVPLNPFNWS